MATETRLAGVNWRTLVSSLAQEHGWPAPSLRPPATAGSLAALEVEFELALPPDLRELLAETDGVFDPEGGAILDGVEGIADMNRYARGPEAVGFMPLESLFFFSSAPGNGDYVGYGLRQDRGVPAVYRWDHEDDSRQWQAPDLTTWLRWTFEREI